MGEPLVSIGVPVLNGERFLERALASLVAQDYGNLEIIISDNASTDRTRQICTWYARNDDRVVYRRNDYNVGAAANYNLVAERASGRYFKWAAHDDWIAPSFVRCCVRHLERDEGLVLCWSSMGVVDDTGEVFRLVTEVLRGADSCQASERFRCVLRDLRDPTGPVFGLMRLDVLRDTPGIRNSPEPDRTLVAELSLRGRIRQIDDVLFFHYGPPGHALHYGDPRRRKRASWEWLHPRNRYRPRLAAQRIAMDHLRAIRSAGLRMSEVLLCGLDVALVMIPRRIRNKLRRLARSRRVS